LKQAFTGAYSWLRSHGSVVLLAFFLLLWANFVVLYVSKPFFVDWVFWAIVGAWALMLFLSFVIQDSIRIRRSISLAILSGVLLVSSISALVGFILRLNQLYLPPVFAFLAVFTVAVLSDILQDRRKGSAPPPITVSSDEKAILDKAQELSHNLQLSKRFHPLYITWTKDILSDEVGFEDGFRKRNLLLPSPLKANLSPDEFRVLIARYLLHQKTVLGRTVLSMVKFFGPLIVYTGVFVYEIPAIVRIPYEDLAWFAGYSVIAAVALKLFVFDDKKQSLATDLVTAHLVGKESLVAVLKKIDDLKLRDMQRLSAKRDLRARLYSAFKPNLQERIDNLMKE
jgi:hypothetical protein